MKRNSPRDLIANDQQNEDISGLIAGSFPETAAGNPAAKVGTWCTLSFSGYLNTVKPSGLVGTILKTGFVHFSRTFQGPNFEISRTSFLFVLKNLRMETV